MCGIAGIISFELPVSSNRIKRMTDVIAHRGPDGDGIWLSEDNSVGLGHRRLSIIDLSSAANQPMHYNDGRYTITFNGEIYNYVEIRKNLKSKGFIFRTESDTEVLLALYHEKKSACLQDLDGMFAFAIWDNIEKTLFCARDRFGEKPFYYSLTSQEFVFGSEIKQLFAANISKLINPQLVYYYINFGLEGNPNFPEQTFYKGINQLLPGHYLILNNNKPPEIKSYWELNTSNYCSISFDDAVEKFRDLFTQSIKRRLRSDVPIGSCLSGGLDSSSIVLSIDNLKLTGQVQKTFSARFKGFEMDEGKYIDYVVKRMGSVQNYDVWISEDNFENELDRIIKFQDEPFGSASIVAQYFVMQLASENGIKVLIDGQGADEYLLGYMPYYSTYLNQLYKESSKKYVIERDKALEFHGIMHELSMLGKIQLKHPSSFALLSNLRNKVLAKKAKLPSNYLTQEFTGKVNNLENPIIGNSNDSVRVAVGRIINGVSFNALLRYADRNAMAHSVEVRLPFLNHELVEFANSLPDSYKIHEGWSKFILRKSMEPVLPKEITWRRDKIGFVAPQQKWMQSNYILNTVDKAKNYLIKEGIIESGFKLEVDNWRSLMLYKVLE